MEGGHDLRRTAHRGISPRVSCPASRQQQTYLRVLRVQFPVVVSICLSKARGTTLIDSFGTVGCGTDLLLSGAPGDRPQQLGQHTKHPFGGHPIVLPVPTTSGTSRTRPGSSCSRDSLKKTDSRLVPDLDQQEVQALLDAPNPATRDGIRDRAMLHIAISGGLRVSELTGLHLKDIAPQSASIRVYGKGRRERALPLWKTTASSTLRAWLAVRGPVAADEVLVNARGEPFSRWGVAYVLRQHSRTATKKCNSLAGKQLSPHVLAHTCAMIMLQATQDIRKVSLWLGHSNLATTEVYVRADPSEKLEAIEAVVPPHLRKGRFRPEDKLDRAPKSQIVMGSQQSVQRSLCTLFGVELPTTKNSP